MLVDSDVYASHNKTQYVFCSMAYLKLNKTNYVSCSGQSEDRQHVINITVDWIFFFFKQHALNGIVKEIHSYRAYLVTFASAGWDGVRSQCVIVIILLTD